MTLQIALVLAILLAAVVLFVTELLRVDVVAMLVLAALALTGLVSATDAISGFSSPAVVTVWAVFILSGGLSRTGIAGLVGRQVLRMSGEGEVRLLLVIMLTSGVLSAFMNNVGVAALLLPVVMDIARQTRRPPSKLLMPLAFGSLLGGLTTLIGTPPNILISGALRDAGLEPFRLFDYTPLGVVLMMAGIAFMAVAGRYLLPEHALPQAFTGPAPVKLEQVYDMQGQLFMMRLPADSGLHGKTLAESQLGSVLGVNVVGILRDGRTQLSPGPGTTLHSGDCLLVTGQPDRLAELRGRERIKDSLRLEETHISIEKLVSTEIQVAEMALSPRSQFLGQTLRQIDFRRRYGVNVLAIWRSGVSLRANLHEIPLQMGDTILIQGPRAQLEHLRDAADFLVSSAEGAEVYQLSERLMAFRVPPDSKLVGKSLADSHLSELFGITVLGIVREGQTRLAPAPTEQMAAGDTLLVQGRVEDLTTLQDLQSLTLEDGAGTLPELESEDVGMVAAILSPQTTLVGQTLSQLHFREKYGLNVLTIWREGRAFRTNLRDMALRFGDALLLYGSREKVMILGREPDFVVLVEEAQETPRLNKALLASLLMAGTILPVILGWQPIYVMAVVGAVIMVVTGCLTMEEAYRYIEWKAVFLIAGMLPLGIALENTGAAKFIAETLVTTIGGMGPTAVMAGLFLLTALATQVMPNPAVAVLLAPIALNMAGDLGVSPYAFMMTVAVSASASFLSPVAHPANVLIMGPGGYRFTDYLKVGMPLTVVILLVTLLLMPFVWPLHP